LQLLYALAMRPLGEPGCENQGGVFMVSKVIGRLALAGVAAALLAASPAAAVTILFSFSSDTNDPAVSNGVAGTVSGRIIGLVDNSTSAATSLFIDSFSVGGFGGVPVDAVTWALQYANSFTLVNGVVTDARFHAATFNPLAPELLYINVPLGMPRGNTNYASVGAGNAISIWNNNGLQGVSFAAVPEPASWALLITGFGLTGASLRRRRVAAIA
jgi:hypothetical protein